VATNAVCVMQIATGQIDGPRDVPGKNEAAAALGRMGGQARAKSLSKTQRAQIAKKAANVRWKRK